MKTFKQVQSWLGWQGLYDKVNENIKKQHSENDIIQNIEDAFNLLGGDLIAFGFAWDNTSEGREYWGRINKLFGEFWDYPINLMEVTNYERVEIIWKDNPSYLTLREVKKMFPDNYRIIEDDYCFRIDKPKTVLEKI